ncbi:MAG: hypothetical protein WCT77_14175, partial [Bacteroidota bacterium]
MNQIETFLQENPNEIEIYAMGGLVGGNSEIDMSVLPQELIDEINELNQITANYTDQSVVDIEKDNIKLIEKIINEHFPESLQPIIDKQLVKQKAEQDA